MRDYVCKLENGGKVRCVPVKKKKSKLGAVIDLDFIKTKPGEVPYKCELHSMETPGGGMRLYCSKLKPKTAKKKVKPKPKTAKKKVEPKPDTENNGIPEIEGHAETYDELVKSHHELQEKISKLAGRKYVEKSIIDQLEYEMETAYRNNLIYLVKKGKDVPTAVLDKTFGTGWRAFDWAEGYVSKYEEKPVVELRELGYSDMDIGALSLEQCQDIVSKGTKANTVNIVYIEGKTVRIDPKKKEVKTVKEERPVKPKPADKVQEAWQRGPALAKGTMEGYDEMSKSGQVKYDMIFGLREIMKEKGVDISINDLQFEHGNYFDYCRFDQGPKCIATNIASSISQNNPSTNLAPLQINDTAYITSHYIASEPTDEDVEEFIYKEIKSKYPKLRKNSKKYKQVEKAYWDKAKAMVYNRRAEEAKGNVQALRHELDPKNKDAYVNKIDSAKKAREIWQQRIDMIKKLLNKNSYEEKIEQVQHYVDYLDKRIKESQKVYDLLEKQTEFAKEWTQKAEQLKAKWKKEHPGKSKPKEEKAVSQEMKDRIINNQYLKTEVLPIAQKMNYRTFLFELGKRTPTIEANDFVTDYEKHGWDAVFMSEDANEIKKAGFENLKEFWDTARAITENLQYAFAGMQPSVLLFR